MSWYKATYYDSEKGYQEKRLFSEGTTQDIKQHLKAYGYSDIEVTKEKKKSDFKLTKKTKFP